MAGRIKLETHEIIIKRRYVRNAPSLNLWNIDGEGLTFNTIFENYLTWLDTRPGIGDDSTKKAFAFDGTHATILQDGQMKTGRFSYGEFGRNTEIVDVISKEVKHNKRRNEAEITPLFFLTYTPRGRRQGLIILERFGNIAMYSQFEKTFTTFIGIHYNDFSVQITSLIPIRILRNFIMHGVMEELTLHKKFLPSDPTDVLIAGGLDTSPDKMVLRLLGKNMVSREQLLRWLEDRHAQYVIPELIPIGFDGSHNTTVKMKVHGSPKEIDFGDQGNIRPYIDIHSDDLVDFNGITKFEEIKNIAIQYALEILTPDLLENQPQIDI